MVCFSVSDHCIFCFLLNINEASQFRAKFFESGNAECSCKSNLCCGFMNYLMTFL